MALLRGHAHIPPLGCGVPESDVHDAGAGILTRGRRVLDHGRLSLSRFEIFEPPRHLLLRGLLLGNDLGGRQRTDGTWIAQTLLSTNMNPTSFGEDANGELYVVDQKGGVYHITDAGPQPKRHRAAH